MKKLILSIVPFFILYLIGINTLPQYIEAERNPVKAAGSHQVSPEAQAIYSRLDFISDLHCDALPRGRNLNKRGDQGHVDFPWTREANVALEMFTIVSKFPAGQNTQSNSENAFDNITPLTIAKGESPWNWFSLFNRTLSQSAALTEFVENGGEKAILVKSKADLENLTETPKSNKEFIGTMLGIEGEHALEGTLENLN